MNSQGTGSGAPLVNCVGIAASGGAIYTCDVGLQAVVRIEADTGARSVVSGHGVGAGPYFVAPFDLEIEPSGALVVVDSGRMAVLRVDPATGARSVVSDLGDPRLGPVAVNPLSIAVALDGRLMVLDRYLGAVFAVEPATGQRWIFSGPDQPGPAFKSALDLSIGANGDVLVADPDAKSVFRLDRGTGARSLLACTRGEHAFGEGPAFHEPVGVVELDDGDFLVGDLGSQEVLRVSPAGDRSIHSGPHRGAGPRIELLMAITRDESGRVFYVERLNDAIVEVSSDGGRRAVSVADRAHVSSFLQPYDISRDTAGNLLVMDRGRGAIIRVKARSGATEVAVELGTTAEGNQARAFGVDVLEDGTLLYPDYTRVCIQQVSPDGARSVFSGAGVGEGPEIRFPGGLDHFPGGEVVMVDAGRLAIMQIGAQGQRRILTGGGVGEGPDFEKLFFVRVGPDGMIYTCDMGMSAVLVVDPMTGARRVVSGFDPGGERVGDGPDLNRPLGFDIDSDGTIYLADFGRNAVLAVDPATGERRVVSDNLSHPGDPFTMPTSVAIKSRRRLAVTDFTTAAVYWVDRRTGRRTMFTDD